MRATVGLLTRFPVGGFPYSDDEFRWSVAYMPVVGALLGLFLAGVWVLAFSRGNGVLAGALVVAVAVLITGALHEDGLADTADALGSSTTRDKALAILKDSRIGTYGALALVITIALRLGALADLGHDASAVIVLSQTMSRAVPPVLITILPYARSEASGKSGPFVGAGLAQASVAVMFALSVAAVLTWGSTVSWGAAFIGVAVATSLTLLLARWYRVRLGGVTGDLLGAAQQLVDVGIVVTLALMEMDPVRDG